MNRFTLAWNALTGNFKAVANMLPTWQDNQPAYTTVNFENMVRAGWRKNELIFACISKTANTAASVKLEVKNRSTDKVIPDHPLRQLLTQPNPFMSEFDLWASIIIYQKLAGCAYFEKERTRGGQIIHLWPLRPDWIHPIMSSRSVISGYQYEVPGLSPQFLKAEDVLDFKMFDPLNAYTGYAPVAVAARVGDVDNAVTDYLKLFFEKGGTPPGILTTTQKLVDSEVANIRRRWAERYGGIDGWLQPAVLDSDASYQQIGSSFKDMGFETLDARNEARICMVLDVPPIIIGAKVGLDSGTYSNYEQARKSWWEDTLVPQYVHVNNEILVDLVPEFGEEIFTAWDYSEVPALRSDDTSKWQTATAAYQAGAITLNEFCERVGLDNKGEKGNIYLGASTQKDTEQSNGKTNEVPILGYHIEQGVVSRNEAREKLGLPAEDEKESQNLRQLTAKLTVLQLALNARIEPEQAIKLVGLEGVTIEEPEPPPQFSSNNTEQPMMEDEEMTEDEKNAQYALFLEEHKDNIDLLGPLTRKAAFWMWLKNKKKTNNAPDDEQRRKKEKQMTKAMESYFSEQLQRVKVELS